MAKATGGYRVSTAQAAHGFEPNGMDDTLMRIGTYAATLDYASLSPSTRAKTVRHLTDTIGCAIGGFDGEPCLAARTIAATTACENGATVIGQKGRTALEHAAFANGCMARYLDCNDTYIAGPSSGHSSDMIPSILAASESRNANGKDLILATHIGYEVFSAVADVTRISERGWDCTYLPALGAAAAIGRIFKMTPVQIANAVSMVATANVPLGIARFGELGSWKGLASSWSSMAALWAVRLAHLDVTGPPRAIEGDRGMWDLVTGKFDLSMLGKPVNGMTAMERTALKRYIAEYFAQSPADTFIHLHKEGVRPDQIKSIRIGTYLIAAQVLGDPRKFDPRNKETADHSIAFILAAILRDGKLTQETYTQASILDPSLRPTMNKISIYEDPALTAKFMKNELENIIDIELNDERTIRKVAGYAPGHPANPLSDQQLREKFHENVRNVISTAKADHYMKRLMDIESVPDVAPLMAELGDFS